MEIRMAACEDARGLLAVYTPYVQKTPVTFEYEVPSLDEFSGRISKILEKYPYYLAEENGSILGYAYASPFKNRAAYDWSVETSIYVERSRQGQGIGKMLYETLENGLIRQNIINLCACIAYPNPGSIAFHKALGYHTTAHFHKAGYKGGKWYDMIWMEKSLLPHKVPPEPFIPFPDLEGKA